MNENYDDKLPLDYSYLVENEENDDNNDKSDDEGPALQVLDAEVVTDRKSTLRDVSNKPQLVDSFRNMETPTTTTTTKRKRKASTNKIPLIVIDEVDDSEWADFLAPIIGTYENVYY